MDLTPSIDYKIRQQDGTFQQMKCPDTPTNRAFVQWLKIHDGAYGGGSK